MVFAIAIIGAVTLLSLVFCIALGRAARRGDEALEHEYAALLKARGISANTPAIHS